MTEDRLMRLNDIVIELRTSLSHLESAFEAHRREVKEAMRDMEDSHHKDLEALEKANTKTQELFSQGRGALWILSIIGTVVGLLLSFGRDIFKSWHQ